MTATETAVIDREGVLAEFEQSHDRILEQLQRLRQLPEQVARHGIDPSTRQTAQELHGYFHSAVLAHHDDEEKELFPALRQCAGKGDEAGLVDSLIQRLEREHDELESTWDRIEPALRRLARGKPAFLDSQTVRALVDGYLAHARFEEKSVLPLAQRMLSANDQAALRLSLAMRHNPSRFRAYI